MVEQGTENPRVSGSIPLRATMRSSKYELATFFAYKSGIEKEVAEFQVGLGPAETKAKIVQ